MLSVSVYKQFPYKTTFRNWKRCNKSFYYLVRFFSANSKLYPEKTRNVGIMAHIDAGKTTTTERMLYYSGCISSLGEVHHGDTVTDYLPQERERGITIQSAVVGFDWKGYHVNLIDTPGHVDFTFEVERSLRVVDSAVAILDASAGVEAQTLTVWRQAAEYQLPRLIYLNKMDKSSASISMCLESIKAKLKCRPILLNLPIFTSTPVSKNSSKLIGLVDLVNLQRIIFKDSTKGAEYVLEDVSKEKEFQNYRSKLVEELSDLDYDLATLVIESESTEKVEALDIQKAIVRIVMSNNGVPVLLGSSYKNIGVQPLMDAIITYLPSPVELKSMDPVISAYGSELCAFAFKSIHDRQLGPLTFVRIFSGTLTTGSKIYNSTREKNEKILKTYLPFADEFREVPLLNAGEVGVVSGLKDTITADTLTSSSSVAAAVQRKLTKKLNPESDVRPILSGVNIPEPVFFCSVEPSSLSQQKGLDAALVCLQREDPSLRVHVDPDTSQTVLSGMGELHLEIIHERLKSEFKLDADLGKLMVAYKETITQPITNRINFERKLADQKHSVAIELEVIPRHRKAPVGAVVRKGLGKEVQENLQSLSDKQMRCITNGVESALRSGPKLCFPVIEVEVCLNYFQVGRGTSETIIEAAAASCVRQCLISSSTVLLEPIVSLEVTVDENYQHVVVDDLNRRRFIMEGVDLKHGNKIISGTAPLSELMGYSTILRTISSGLGTYSMRFKEYQLVTNILEEEKIMTKVRGF